MEAEIDTQLDLFDRISKAYTNFKKSPKERITVVYLETRLESLEKLWHQFSSVHTSLVEGLTHAGVAESVYGTKDIYDITDELYLDYKCAMKTALSNLMPKQHASLPMSSSPASKPPHVNLPKITIPTFSGHYTEWMSFRDLFVSLIHDNADIDNVQKLHYLKGHVRGEAEQLLRHIPITNDSYEQCWTLLKGRYNNKQYLINCILKRFFAQKNVVSESANAIKELLDVTSETLNALASLGINTQSWDVLIIYIVSQRLDAESRKQWESKVSELMTADSDQLPTLTKFKEFLETKYHSLEFLDSKTSTSVGQRQRTSTHNVKDGKANPIHMLHVTKVSCVCCKRDHHLRNCKEFVNMDTNSKRNFVQVHGFCFNCLGSNHSVKHCRNFTSCQICKKRHHSLLHPKGENQPADSAESVDDHVTSLIGQFESLTGSPGEMQASAKVASHFVEGVAHQVLLATALVKAEPRNGGEYQLLRALIDQGSQASFITKAAVQLLGLKTIPTKGIISGLGGEQNLVSRSIVEISISSRLNSSCVFRVTAYVLDKLTAYLPAKVVSVTAWPELEQVVLADPEYHTPNKIDVLLGAEIYSSIINSGVIKSPSGSLVAQNTTLGWVLSGKIKTGETVTNKVVAMHAQVEYMEQLLRSFWEVEAEPCANKKVLTIEEQRCEEIYNSTTTRDKDGRYVVRLPFRDDHPACADGQSRSIALKRFHFLERKLQKNQRLKQEYTNTFEEYLQLNHMQKINNDTVENPPKGLYLPYHVVIREDKETTKFRIVFDASCKGVNGVSLNNDLMVGPTLQPELRHIIMRWRMHPICFIADIVKMYRQIKVHDADSEYQRILWRESPDETIQEYKLLRVTFGTSSAPYLAVKSLMQVAIDEGQHFPLAAERVKQDFYMDDLMSGCEEPEEAIEIYTQITALLKRGGFELQKWSSNCEAVLKQIREETRPRESDKHIEVKLDNINKILGLTWSRQNDEFMYAVQLPLASMPVTKRKVISDISKLYDPQGWIAPSIIKAKIFIQKLWLAGIDWDDELPPPLLEEWLEYRKGLSDLTRFRLNRWMNARNNSQLIELHGFSDASNAAFAAVIYLRVKDAEGKVHVSLVTAKTRVAPIKQLSIPRLELSGSVLLARLLVEVAGVLTIPKENIHAWTDSEIVLAWLSGHPSKWKTFIGNRVSEILTVTSRSQWAHVQSEQNPADCASRGISPAELINHHLWTTGPAWLRDETINYINPKHLTTKLEEKKIETYLAATTSTPMFDSGDDTMWSKYSSLTKLLRVVAYCRRFLKPRNKKHTYLLKEEIDEALVIMIKACQNQTFGEEMQDVQRGNLKRKSQLTSLNPQIDELGLLRVGGRLQFADIEFDQKHPILLPKSSWLTQLIIKEAHGKTLHGGTQAMINYLRSKYWIIGMKSLVKSHVRKCITCVRHAVSTRNQLMGQLPSPRVTMARAFQRSGVDYAGPINLRVSKGRGNKSYKGYICLFICMATRAVHLEVVSELSTQGFLAAFKRFIARRGHCSDIYSDNGSNFLGASKELKQVFQAEKYLFTPEIADWMATNGTQWHFIPPYAPNFGGLWEAGIKSCKFHLKRVIGNHTLTFEEMTTVLSQIEACLNSRPMSSIDDQGERMPLTPGHFLVGEPLVVVPDHQYEQTPITSLRRWQLCQRMLQDFWRRWSQEYLTQFLQRHKWTQRTPGPEIGDVALVKEPDLPPAKWLLGKVIAIHPGLDKITRVVTLRCKNSQIKRPVSKLCILPVTD